MSSLERKSSLVATLLPSQAETYVVNAGLIARHDRAGRSKILSQYREGWQRIVLAALIPAAAAADS